MSVMKEALTRIEACQVLLDGGKLEYSHINSDYWSDLTNRELVFTLDDNYIFRETPKYEYLAYDLNSLADYLNKNPDKPKAVYMMQLSPEGEVFLRVDVISLNYEKLIIEVFNGKKFYKRVKAEDYL